MPETPPSLFDAVPAEMDFPSDERRIQAFWKDRRIFERTLETREGAPSFVFYEGPPTANGLPHNGHVLTRVIKDLFPRFKTMTGHYVPRKAGWDTHGLPVEVEVEKELRIHGKAEIERYGVEPFTERCIESVFRYTSEWERLTERIGFWVDLNQAYVTYHRPFVESVWWALAELHRKGLLYQGHKVVWWWPQGGTALSAAEVGLGYKTVDDPSVYVAFPLRDTPDTALVVWTTTPWTLPSNMYAAVNPNVDYVTVDAGERKLIVAAALREALAKKLKTELPVLATQKGSDLVGRRYQPPFDVYHQRAGEARLPLKDGGEDAQAWRVLGADFVTLDSGTGIVHIAPAFGEDDYEAFRKDMARFAQPDALELFCAVKPDGTFSDEVPLVAGRFVKEADKDLQRHLKERGLVLFTEQYKHEYPFCWRADDDPLIQFARPAWYIRTTSVKDEAIANNRAVNWVPEHIKEGRFGDFLANNVDWALSRERYWGTPLPLWVHSETGEVEAISSLQALREKPGNNLAAVEAELNAFLEGKPHEANAKHLIVHKPWIDKVTFEKPGTPGQFRRVPEVVDVWFDSGCMPFAQWGFPHAPGSREIFNRAFPADFISEAIDQTRGWFYSLLMVSTLLFDEETQARMGLTPRRGWPQPYKSCIVLGHVSDKEGRKESKSKGNYTPPEIILDDVRMDFAVLTAAEAGVPGEPGVALIAREDLEGLDIQEGARVQLFRPDRPEVSITATVKAHKKLKRRVVLLAPAELQALGVAPSARGASVMPVEVPRLAPAERVVVKDPAAKAPGADAFRWFFYAASPTWSNTRHSLSNVRLLQKDFQVKLRNVYSFFTIYANIDGFNPAAGNADAADAPWEAIRRSQGWREVKARPVLDRWILSEVHLTLRDVTRALETYQVYDAAQRLVALVDALSNWYLRRSRSRFWAPGFEQDKHDAYFTLYEALTTLTATAAPFIPFFTDEMWGNLVRKPWPTSQPESVHLARFPAVDEALIDEGLAAEMGAVRDLVSLGLKVRTDNRLKVRQPLSRADVILARKELTDRVAVYKALIADELNVHEVRFVDPGSPEANVVRFRVRPNLRAVGGRLGPKLAPVRKAFDSGDGAALHRELLQTGRVALTVAGEDLVFTPEELETLVEANPGYAAAGMGVGVVVLHTELTEALVDEGLVRELLARVQGARKDLELGYTDRIQLWVDGDARVKRVTDEARELIARETLAASVLVGPEGLTGQEEEVSLNGLPARIRVARA
ncbi:isoleucine--tRNA ligase [Corallococcus macrosporus]|uniref:Isoleucine--tRNA ligase n=1 Tax=Myxococcus fulvus (strain ATCC BAA-855 / HW-1) TaxID=483219 RepID=F8CH59_MYXFH|nr:isoleucine--tRNA ligase [Corallococcus macrosporus]AEI64976.1 putative isoleucyl-tRNA synthetase, mupirocin resistant [Corallococcus macrosporus]